MSLSSNLYADKVFAEQPIALWSLDDELNFLSLLPASYTSASSWSKNIDVADLSVYFAEDDEFVPITSSPKIDISAVPSSSGPKTARISLPIGNLNILNNSGTVALSTYLYSKNELITEVKLGISYTDPDTNTQIDRVDYTETVQDFRSNVWGMISKTFAVPTTPGTFSIFIEIDYAQPPVGVVPIYEFSLNGLTLGQESEEFNTYSVGKTTSLVSASISIPECKVVPALSYGLQANNGYYIADSNRLYAKNMGLPMVYGASNVTRLYPNTNMPSAIFPGFGFLNAVGRYKEYTAEFWLRAPHTSTSPKRIFGPISSEDGLYVYGSFLMLKIGDAFRSHSIFEWGRPMLISFTLSASTATVMINGEQVIELEIPNNVSYPNKFDAELKDQDWLGFYAYESAFEIDCFAIYPYKVSEAIAKRRFVYGQGVDLPQNINTGYSGSAYLIDYPFAKYANNYTYPDIGPWSQGVTENLTVDVSKIASPQYNLPEVFLSSNVSTKDWLEACRGLSGNGSPFLTFNYLGLTVPDNESYILINDFGQLTQNIGGVFGVFAISENPPEEQILFWFENEQSNNYFSVSILNDTLTYKLGYNSQVQVVYEAIPESMQNKFVAGINIRSLSRAFGGSVASFFGDVSQLKLYVGGNKNLSNTFYGNIYKVAVLSLNNMSVVGDLFNPDGFAITLDNVFELYFNEDDSQIDFTRDGGEYQESISDWPTGPDYDGGLWSDLGQGISLEQYVAAYTLQPVEFNNEFILDIATSSYWKDYVPLKYFAKYVDDGLNDRVYTLDFLQFNIGYPRPRIATADATADYPVKTYVTFKYLRSGAYTNDSFYLYKESVPANGVITPGSAWERTKYEVVDGTIIYMPPNADYENLSIGISIEIVNKGIRQEPVQIKTLQLASQAYNVTGPNPIFTKSGSKVFPYVRKGIYFDYKDKNPLEIYKGSSPYLYLTDSSGIKLKGDYSANRGVSIPINTSIAETFAVGALQVNVKNTEALFPTTPQKIFEVDSKNLKLDVYVAAVNAERTRAKLFTKNADNETLVEQIEYSTLGVSQLEGVSFYLNGQMVKEVFLNINEWSTISMQFAEPLVFNSYVGAFRQTGSMLVNTPIIYPLSSSQTIANLISRLWQDLPSIDINYWSDLLSSVPAFSWANVLYIPAEKNYTIDPAQKFKEFIGTNRVSVSDNGYVLLQDYEYTVYKGITSQSTVLSAV